LLSDVSDTNNQILGILINVVLVTNTLTRTRFWYMWKGFAYLTPLGMIVGAILGLLLSSKGHGCLSRLQSVSQLSDDLSAGKVNRH
jgi:F0F1-type ATP synthase assembly protein I